MVLESVGSITDVFPLENGNVNDAARSYSRHVSENAVRHPFDSTSDPSKDDHNPTYVPVFIRDTGTKMTTMGISAP